MEMFLAWFDDSNKKPVQTKIEEAVERFTHKFGLVPDVCLVNEREVIELAHITVRPTRHIRPNYFWVGRGEPVVVDAPASPVVDRAPGVLEPASPARRRAARAAAAPVAIETPAPAPEAARVTPE